MLKFIGEHPILAMFAIIAIMFVLLELIFAVENITANFLYKKNKKNCGSCPKTGCGSCQKSEVVAQGFDEDESYDASSKE